MPPLPDVKRILVPTDFSPLGNGAVRTAAAIAADRGAELIVLHVIEPPVTYRMTDAGVPAAWPTDAQLHEAAKTEMREVVQALRADGATVKSVVAIGAPAAEIVRTAEDNDVDLIVIATHGRSGLSHALIGSVAERVVQKAPCAVLTVKPPREED